MRKYLMALFSAVLAAALITDSIADKRSYVWTYEYLTMEKGKAELEHYLTFSAPHRKDISGSMSAQQQFELEVGMSENWDFAIYQVFEQEPEEDFKYSGFKLRSRHKIGKKGQFVLDPLIYLEYKNNSAFSEPGFEAKLILSRDFGKLNISFNPIFEYEFEEEENEWEFESAYALGASYEISKLLRLGVEVKGSEDGHYVGPTVSHGTEKLWVALGIASEIIGLKGDEPELQIRLLTGVGF